MSTDCLSLAQLKAAILDAKRQEMRDKVQPGNAEEDQARAIAPLAQVQTWK